MPVATACWWICSPTWTVAVPTFSPMNPYELVTIEARWLSTT
jgi:hypothetical protein